MILRVFFAQKRFLHSRRSDSAKSGMLSGCPIVRKQFVVLKRQSGVPQNVGRPAQYFSAVHQLLGAILLRPINEFVRYRLAETHPRLYVDRIVNTRPDPRIGCFLREASGLLRACGKQIREHLRTRKREDAVIRRAARKIRHCEKRCDARV